MKYRGHGLLSGAVDAITAILLFAGFRMHDCPLAVSVIIPTYNRERFLSKAIDSVMAQTFRDYELIIVDDGSTDNTEVLVKARDGVRYFRLAENAGVSKARNLGIKQACGKYVCFLDSDDLWVKDKLERQIHYMESDAQPVVCYTDEIWVRNGTRVNAGKRHRKYSGNILANCLALCIISPSSIMLRAAVFDVIGLFDETLPACEDYDLWLRLSARFPVHCIPRKLIIKTGGHADQLSRKYDAMDRFRVYAIDKLLCQVSLEAITRRLAIETLIKKCDILVKGCVKRNKKAEARIYQDLMEKYSLELTT